MGNFHELFQLFCKYDPRIKRSDAVPKNKNTAGQDLQKDLIDAEASLLLRHIKQELHSTETTYYAILADECLDQSERQLVEVCLRYLCRESIRERVGGFVETGDTSAEGIALKILQILEPIELDSGLCVGFGFDGASANV
ncbi:vWFA and Collagen domain-containing protein [Tachysurus ichikawai]